MSKDWCVFFFFAALHCTKFVCDFTLFSRTLQAWRELCLGVPMLHTTRSVWICPFVECIFVYSPQLETKRKNSNGRRVLSQNANSRKTSHRAILLCLSLLEHCLPWIYSVPAANCGLLRSAMPSCLWHRPVSGPTSLAFLPCFGVDSCSPSAEH